MMSRTITAASLFEGIISHEDIEWFFARVECLGTMVNAAQAVRDVIEDGGHITTEHDPAISALFDALDVYDSLDAKQRKPRAFSALICSPNRKNNG